MMPSPDDTITRSSFWSSCHVPKDWAFGQEPVAIGIKLPCQDHEELVTVLGHLAALALSIKLDEVHSGFPFSARLRYVALFRPPPVLSGLDPLG